MTEKLSQLLDGELSEFERHRILNEMGNDVGSSNELRNRWERYHLIRAAMRNELSPVPPRQFADRVVTALHSEPPARGPLIRPGMRRAVQIAGGMAIAASVATIAVFNLRPVVAPVPVTPPLASVAPGPGDEPVALAAVSQTQTQTGTQIKPQTVAANTATAGADINPYLVQHSEAAGTMGAWRPYVRVVSHSSSDQ